LAGFSRNSDGRFHLVHWAEVLSAAGLPVHVAHFLLWSIAVTIQGCCFAVAMALYCRYFLACCPSCGGAAYWQSLKTIAYVCQGCGYRHETGFDWGEG
jgi:hypothetical protein